MFVTIGSPTVENCDRLTYTAKEWLGQHGLVEKATPMTNSNLNPRTRFRLQNAWMPLNLSHACFTSANFAELDLRDAVMNNAVFVGADFSHSQLGRANFQFSDLHNADLTGADLQEADFSNANLQNCRLPGADLRRANLSGANLQGADLTGALLNQADFSNANLQRADLSNASLNSAILNRSLLRSVMLNSASLRNANLEACDLSFADCTRADFRFARMLRTRFLQTQFGESRWEEAAVGATHFIDVDLSVCQGMDKTHHQEPSYLDVHTFRKSRGRIDTTFLAGCGLSNWEVTMVRSYEPKLSSFDLGELQEEWYETRSEHRLFLAPLVLAHSADQEELAIQLRDRLVRDGASVLLTSYPENSQVTRRMVQRIGHQWEHWIFLLSDDTWPDEHIRALFDAAYQRMQTVGPNRDGGGSLGEVGSVWGSRRRNQPEWQFLQAFDLYEFNGWQYGNFDSCYQHLLDQIDCCMTRDSAEELRESV